MYKKAAEFWTELRVEILTATAYLTNEKPASSQVWRLYWASHQVLRFFVHGCLKVWTSTIVQTITVVLLDFLKVYL